MFNSPPFFLNHLQNYSNPGLQQANYFNQGNAGYSNPGNAGYFNQGNVGYSNPGYAGYSNPGYAGYFNQGNAGYFNQGNAGYFNFPNLGMPAEESVYDQLLKEYTKAVISKVDSLINDLTDSINILVRLNDIQEEAQAESEVTVGD